MQVGEIVEGDQTREFLITGSRDKSIMLWDIQEKSETDPEKEWGVPRKVLKGKVLIFPLNFKFRPLSLHQ
jgi:hypothetical protein